jgi:hypothetical protein
MPIENTSKRDPLVHILGAMSDGGSDYITGMEAAGQRQLVNSTDLPSDAHGREADFVALGFTFGEPHQHDPMFRPATLPEGWTREGSEHAMWSYLVDEKGRQRVGIFYKAAFYDRSAAMSLVHPANRLSNAYYADEAPTSIDLDELLTVEVAQKWLAAKREERAEYLDMVVAQGGDAERVADYAAQVARVDLMLSLLPVEDDE